MPLQSWLVSLYLDCPTGMSLSCPTQEDVKVSQTLMLLTACRLVQGCHHPARACTCVISLQGCRCIVYASVWHPQPPYSCAAHSVKAMHACSANKVAALAHDHFVMSPHRANQGSIWQAYEQATSHDVMHRTQHGLPHSAQMQSHHGGAVLFAVQTMVQHVLAGI